jgi:flagellum-specific peptidoglycan hydrolase FlgJ
MKNKDQNPNGKTPTTNKTVRNNALMVPFQRAGWNQHDTVGALLKALFILLWLKFKRFVKDLFYRLTWVLAPATREALWKVSKIGVLVIFAYSVLKNDFHFQFNMNGSTVQSASVVNTSFGGDGVSEFAPADPANLKDEENIDYINSYKYLAVEEMKRTGIPASITLSQAIIESRSGASRLAKDLNNHFGIKCFSKTCHQGHCKNYTDDSHKDFFRNFTKVKDCYKSHSQVVLNSRYTSRVGNKKSYRDWAYALQEGGYATGDRYKDKLIYIIERYKLYELDK